MQTMITFTCWKCGMTCEYELDALQRERKSLNADPLEINPAKPHKYFVRCSNPECKAYNTVAM